MNKARIDVRALFMMMYSLHLKYLETGDKFEF